MSILEKNVPSGMIGDILRGVKLLSFIFLFICLSMACGDGKSELSNLSDTGRRTTSDVSKTHSIPSELPVAPLQQSVKPRLLSFSRAHCLPCELMSPWVDAIARDVETLVEVSHINLDRKENHDLGRTLKIRTVPTQIYLAPDNSVLYRHEGVATEAQMRRILCKLGWVSCRK